MSWTPSGGSTWTYSYDALERLIAVRQGGALIARYGYDGLGRRIVKRVYSGANAGYLRMLYRGGHVLAEADSAGTLTLGYTWGLATDDQVAVHRYSDGGHWYVVQDHLRSVRGLSRKDGTWVASWRYRLYGAVLDSAYSDPVPIALRYRWTGREYDAETGFYFFRSRYYDPRVQRFVQEDPIAFAGGVNLYGYGDGNPTNGRDPDGLAMDPDMYTRDPNDRIWQCMGTTDGCYGGGGGDWDGNGIDDGQEFFDDVWTARGSGLTMNEQDRLRAQGTESYVRVENGRVVAAGRVAQPGEVFLDRPVTIASAVQATLEYAQGSAIIRFIGRDPILASRPTTRPFIYLIVDASTGVSHVLQGTWVRGMTGRQSFATYQLRFGRLDGLTGAHGGAYVWKGVVEGWVAPPGYRWWWPWS